MPHSCEYPKGRAAWYLGTCPSGSNQRDWDPANARERLGEELLTELH